MNESLEVVSDCFLYFSTKLDKHQYYPYSAAKIAANRLLTQYHAQYPEHKQHTIIDWLLPGSSVLRILFLTVALGTGIVLNNIRRIIHIRVSYSMEEYFYEVGCAGRNVKPASAIMHFNFFEVSKTRKGMSDVMRDYATAAN